MNAAATEKRTTRPCDAAQSFFGLCHYPRPRAPILMSELPCSRHDDPDTSTTLRWHPKARRGKRRRMDNTQSRPIEQASRGASVRHLLWTRLRSHVREREVRRALQAIRAASLPRRRSHPRRGRRAPAPARCPAPPVGRPRAQPCVTKRRAGACEPQGCLGIALEARETAMSSGRKGSAICPPLVAGMSAAPGRTGHVCHVVTRGSRQDPEVALADRYHPVPVLRSELSS